MNTTEKDALKLGLDLHERMISRTASLTRNLAEGAFVRDTRRLAERVARVVAYCEYNREYETVQSLLDHLNDLSEAVTDLVEYQQGWVDRLFPDPAKEAE